MIRIFTGNRPIVLFLLPLLVVFFHIINHGFLHIQSDEMEPFGLWHGYAIRKWIGVIGLELLAILGVTINAITLNFVYNTNEFQDRNNYLVSLLYVVLCSFFESFYLIDGLLFAHFFLILGLFNFFKLKQNTDGQKPIFNGAFFFGMAATFQPYLYFVFPIFIWMYLLVKSFSFRELFLFLLGFLIPFWFAFSTLVVTNRFQDLNPFVYHTFDWRVSTSFSITGIVLLLLVSFCFIGLRDKLRTSSNRLKKQLTMFWLLLFITLISYCFDLFFYQQFNRIGTIVIPLAVLFSYPLLNKRFRFIAQILFYLIFVYNVLKFFLPFST